jgi:hypothetical protein
MEGEFCRVAEAHPFVPAYVKNYNLGGCGRWAFAEFTDVYEMQEDFAERIEQEFDTIVK